MVTSAEIAERTGYILSGNRQISIRGIAYSDIADEGVISVVFSQKQIDSTRSNIILSEPCMNFCNKTFIFSHEPINRALVQVAKVLIKAGIYPDYSRISSKLESRLNCFLDPSSTIGEACQLGTGCIIHNNVSIGKHCSIGAYSEIFPGTEIGDDVHIGSGCSIGANAFFRVCLERQELFCGIGRVLINDSVSIGNNVTIQRGVLSDTIIGENTIIGNLIDIAHDVTIGTDCFIVSQTGIAGNAFIGNHVTIYGQTGIANKVHLGNHVTVYGQSFVTKNVTDFQSVSGCPAFDHRKDMACLARIRRKE